MSRIISLVLLLCITTISLHAQDTPKKNNEPIDSLFDLNLLMELLDSVEKPKSFLSVSVGIGNKLFSENNNTINASQTDVNKLYYTPSIAYYHKSGFSISVTPYITFTKGSAKVYQTALSPSYNFSDKKYSVGISYVHYFSDKKTYYPNTIFDNDLYAMVRYKKWFIAPSLSAGYAAGKFKEINTIGTSRIVFDTTNNTIKDFSLSLAVDHEFEYNKLFNKKDGIVITPQIILNAGSESYKSVHVNKNFAVLARRTNRVRFLTQTDKTPITIQSLALSLNVEYFVKNLSISPNMYADYYLPASSLQKLNTVYSITLGYTF